VKVADAPHTSTNFIVYLEIRSRISSKLGKVKAICCEIWYVMEIILRSWELVSKLTGLDWGREQ